MRYGFVIIFQLFIFPALSQSDLHITKHWAVRDGLSNNTVYCITQDQRGFLWLGTKEGLNRFDGFQFEKYFTEKNNPNSLSNNSVFDMLENSPGQLLIATGNGLSVLNTLTGKFENEKISFAPVKAGCGNIISSLFKDKKGNIWVNHSGELDVFDSNLKYIHRFTDLDWARALKRVTIYFESWYLDKQDRLWLPTDTSGLQIIDFNLKKVFNRKNNPENLPWLNHVFIRSFLLDEANNLLWIAPWGKGLIKYDLLTGKKTQQNFAVEKKGEERTINSITKIGNGNLLCTIDGKCFEVNEKTLSYKSIVVPAFSSGVEKKAIHSIGSFITNKSHYWIGTYEGLFQLKAENSSKELTINKDDLKPIECSDLINAASGKLYAAYNDNRLFEIERDWERYNQYALPEGQEITEVCEDRANRIWVGTTNDLWLFDVSNRTFSKPLNLPKELRNVLINTIFCENSGDVWIVTREPFFFYRYKIRSNTFEKIDNNVIRQLGNVSENSRISTIAEDKKGNLWMVSVLGGGIICYEKNKNEWKLYPPGRLNTSNLVKKGINSISVDKNSSLWLTTVLGDGLIRYDYKNDSITQFTRNDGLPGDHIQSVNADPSGNLWLTTEYGITQFNPKTFKSESSYLSAAQIFITDQHHSVFDSLTNRLVVAFPNRLLFISAGKDIFTTPLSHPLISKISINNEEQFIDPLKQDLKLGSKQKNISIDFTAISFSGVEKLRFAYMLAGADKDWKYVDAGRTANYTTLSPGTYTFNLKSGNENGEWSSEVVKFTFTISPPWWQTWWFRIGLGVLLLSTGIWLFRKRIKTIRHEAQLKQQIAETEMMALRAQMNPHFIFNCINSIDAMIQSNDKYHATLYLNKFAKLIRNILDSSKQNLVALSKDLETLQLYVDLEMFRHENKFKAEIHADPQLWQGDYQVPPLIIQPYVENAILHGLRHREDNNGMLTVKIKKQNGTLNYEIADNGVGRKKDHTPPDLRKTNRYGMQISHDRIRIYNNEEKASVQVIDLLENDQPAGTKVTVQLKIH